MKEGIAVYKPRPSKGGLYLGLTVSVFLIFEILSTVGLLKSDDFFVFLLLVIFFATVVIVLLSFLGWFPSMVYELTDQQLVLRCGRLKSVIHLHRIQKIRQKDLAYDMTSTGFKFPGYCLFRVKYADEGWVHMYSRSVCKNILLIEADGEKYGITPGDPEVFLNDLKQRIDKNSKEQQ